MPDAAGVGLAFAGRRPRSVAARERQGLPGAKSDQKRGPSRAAGGRRGVADPDALAWQQQLLTFAMPETGRTSAPQARNVAAPPPRTTLPRGCGALPESVLLPRARPPAATSRGRWPRPRRGRSRRCASRSDPSAPASGRARRSVRATPRPRPARSDAPPRRNPSGREASGRGRSGRSTAAADGRGRPPHPPHARALHTAAGLFGGLFRRG